MASVIDPVQHRGLDSSYDTDTDVPHSAAFNLHLPREETGDWHGDLRFVTDGDNPRVMSSESVAPIRGGSAFSPLPAASARASAVSPGLRHLPVHLFLVPMARSAAIAGMGVCVSRSNSFVLCIARPRCQ